MHLHHSTAKKFKPWIHCRRALWYHFRFWRFFSLVEIWCSTPTQAMYKSAASCSNSKQTTRQNPFVIGPVRSPTPSNKTILHNENVRSLLGMSWYLGHTTKVNLPWSELISMNWSWYIASPTQQNESQAGRSAYQKLTLTSSIVLDKRTKPPTRYHDPPQQVEIKVYVKTSFCSGHRPYRGWNQFKRTYTQ